MVISHQLNCIDYLRSYLNVTNCTYKECNNYFLCELICPFLQVNIFFRKTVIYEYTQTKEVLHWVFEHRCSFYI